MWFNSHRLLLLVGQEEIIAAMAAKYLRILFPGLCCFMVTQCLQSPGRVVWWGWVHGFSPAFPSLNQQKSCSCSGTEYHPQLSARPGVIARNWLAAQRVTGIQASSGALLALVHLPLCWYLVHQMGYLGAAIATSVGNFLRMLWVIFKRLGISWDGTWWWRPVGFQGDGKIEDDVQSDG